jgi:carbamoyl-phosphate synthase large subunit
MKNILITSGGRRVSLVKTFKLELQAVFPESKVYITDYNPAFSAAAQIADKAFQICKIEDKSYIESLLNLCVLNNVKLVIPTLDPELIILSENKNKFDKLGIELVLSNNEFVTICNDKLETEVFFKNTDISVPLVYKKDDYKIPLFIKPKKGSSSINNYIIKDKKQISKYHLENDEFQFFEYIDHTIFDEYTCDLYYNKVGKLKCVIPRLRIETRGGEVSKGLTCRNELKTFIENKWDHIDGAKGCITAQFFMHKVNKEIIGIEINARFGGGFPLSYLAGGNYPKWIIQEYFLNEEVTYFNTWENNLLMLRYDDEILIHNYEV